MRYLTQKKMAARLGVSIVTFNRYVASACFKLGLSETPPRSKIPAETRRALLAAVTADAICDLCQRPLARLPIPVDEHGIAGFTDLIGPPRFAAPVSIDHIVPVARGGTNDASNLRVVHLFCNLSDGARTPITQLGTPMFGYVWRSATLPSGRGPRKWIEPDAHAVPIVQFLMDEYATGRHSIASLARLLAVRKRRFDARAASAILRDSALTPADHLLWILEYHSTPRTERDVLRGYVALVPPATAEACAELLARRANRIRRARETRERRLRQATRAARVPRRRAT